MSTFILCACVWEREYMHVCETKTSSLFSCLVSSLYGIVTNYLYLAVIPAHIYIAFPTPAAYFTSMITWIWNLAVFSLSCLLFPVAELCLWSPRTFPLVHDQGWFGSGSYVVWQPSFESSVRKTYHVLVILFLSSGWWAVKGVGIQGGNAKMYHSIKGLLCFTLAGVSVNHLVHGVYILWSCCRIFFPFWYFIYHLLWYIVLRSTAAIPFFLT